MRVKTKKIILIIVIIFAVIIFISIGVFLLMQQAAKSMGIGSGKVEDYDTRIEIWETVAGNSDRSKLDDMNIDYGNKNTLFATITFADKIVNSHYEDAEREIDTFTYLYEIKGGYENETYTDVPYLIPYLVDDSDSAVIVIPGGGFGYKSMDGNNSEGKDIAATLNKNGISAFVLHYRTNPYEYPISYLDLQRAVRYLRFHADEFHISPEKNKLDRIQCGRQRNRNFHQYNPRRRFFPRGLCSR